MGDFCPFRRIFHFLRSHQVPARLGILGHAEGVHEALNRGGGGLNDVWKWNMYNEHGTDTSW